MQKIIMFLDFDGVLHPKMNGTFEHMDNLKKVLDKYPQIDIVISSSWRFSMDAASTVV
jgi:hypothetical protein